MSKVSKVSSHLLIAEECKRLVLFYAVMAIITGHYLFQHDNAQWETLVYLIAGVVFIVLAITFYKNQREEELLAETDEGESDD